MKKSLLTFALLVLTIAGATKTANAETPNVPTGAAGGVFRVSDTRRVWFSQGNLQFRTTGKHRCADGTEQTGTWRFAEKQYGFAGNSADVGPAYTEWFGTFAWGTGGWSSGAVSYQPWSKSNNADAFFLKGDPAKNMTGDCAYADWGVYNAISNGGNEPGLWRTLTVGEWRYLLRNTRWTAVDMQPMDDAQPVIGGILLLPDGAVLPEGCDLKMVNIGKAESDYFYFSHDDVAKANRMRADSLDRLLALTQAVYLPAAGFGQDIYSAGCGVYWSASVHPGGISNVDVIYMEQGQVAIREQGWDRSLAAAVRLVQDYVEGVEVVEREALPATFHVSEDKQVRFSGGNLQYLTETDQWIFAPTQYNIRGNANLRVTAAGDTVFGKAIDLFGWSTRYKRGAFGISLFDPSLYKDTAFVDWGGNAVINSGNQPDQWRTLTKDEWLYLLRHTPWTIARVEGIWGCMLVPDEDALPQKIAVDIITGGTPDATSWTYTLADYQLNIYTAGQFEQMEAAGVVFLPFAGTRNLKNQVRNVGTDGIYWSSTYTGGTSKTAQRMCFGNRSAAVVGGAFNNAYSVRLVQDVTSGTAVPATASDTATTVRKVLRHGQILIEKNGKTYTILGQER